MQPEAVPELLYLDYNCFQRGFDDPAQVRIRMESDACESIFEQAAGEGVTLVWSFMHEDENRLCPFTDRKTEIARLSVLCRVRVAPLEPIRLRALDLQREMGVGAKDALHLAAAVHARADWFVTCDDGILSKADRLRVAVRVVDPVDYVLKKRR